MRMLVVHAHPDPVSFSAALVEAIVDGAGAGGHEAKVVRLYEESFATAMSPDERRSYHGAEPILDAQVRDHAELVRWADTLVFVYPTWWAGMPAVMKGWLERVLVPGVAFTLDARNKVQPGLGHIRRLVGVSTYGSRRSYVAVLSDAGRRTITRTLRMSCGWRTRTTWLGLYNLDRSTPAQRYAFVARVASTIERLR